MHPAPIARWRAMVSSHDLADLSDLLADDAVFQSPAVFAPQAGKALVTKYLYAALAVLNDDSFRYTNEWVAPRSAVLEFELEMEGVSVNGVDIIEWNEAGRITCFKVMIRPMKALNAVVAKMGVLLAA